MCEAVRLCDSSVLQRRLCNVNGDARDKILHAFGLMKSGWIEEVMDKLKCYEELPLLVVGLWPQDDGAQAVAQRALDLWSRVGNKHNAHRVTLDFLLEGRFGTLASQLRILASSGIHHDELAYRAKCYNIMMTHAQRVEELHARIHKVLQRPGRNPEVPAIASAMGLQGNLSAIKVKQYVYVCMHVCLYACMHVCMYVCMYVCVFVCLVVCVL